MFSLELLNIKNYIGYYNLLPFFLNYFFTFAFLVVGFINIVRMSQWQLNSSQHPLKCMAIVSCLFFLSYLSTGSVGLYSGNTYTYYLLSELLLALIIIFLLTKKVIYCNTFLIYVFTGLLVNALLFVMMILITEFASYSYVTAHPYLWPLAYLYSYGINIADFMMVLALLTNKDFLGLQRLKNRLASKEAS